MKTVSLRQVKREIRVLGISFEPSQGFDHINVIGVIFRGGNWIDGVIRTTAFEPDVTERTAEMITTSPHHPQIRVILLDKTVIEGGAYIDPHRLSTMTARPVILISTDEIDFAPKPNSDLAFQRFILKKDSGELFVISIGLDRQDAVNVLEVSTRKGILPEALRVAELISSTLAACPEQNV